MAKNFLKGDPQQAGHGTPGFDASKNLRLGTLKSPAQISVKSDVRKAELLAVFEENGWASVIAVDPDQDENTRDLEALQSKPVAVAVSKLPNRNDPCTCGSGKKYKKCCAT